VDPVPDPLLLRKSGSAGIESGTSWLAVRNSDHQTTEAVAASSVTKLNLFHFRKLFHYVSSRDLLSPILLIISGSPLIKQ
jgi:hypothetical protein